MIVLPIQQVGPLFGFTCELDGVTYGFTFRWNQRMAQWQMTVADGEGTALVHGIGVTLGFPMLKRYRPAAPALPPGELLVVDTSGQNLDADFEDLGRRIVIVYVSPGDL